MIRLFCCIGGAPGRSASPSSISVHTVIADIATAVMSAGNVPVCNSNVVLTGAINGAWKAGSIIATGNGDIGSERDRSRRA